MPYKISNNDNIAMVKGELYPNLLKLSLINNKKLFNLFTTYIMS